MVNIFICDKNPYKAAEYLIEHTNKTFVFKSLLELCQLICSAGISDVYKKVNQGKELQEWILKNKEFIFVYFNELFNWVKHNIGISVKTWEKIAKIQTDLYFSSKKIAWDYPKTAIFRYVKEYAEMTEYESNSELPIDECVECYRKYVSWKEDSLK